jgi:hypothetical protein
VNRITRDRLVFFADHRKEVLSGFMHPSTISSFRSEMGRSSARLMWWSILRGDVQSRITRPLMK